MIRNIFIAAALAFAALPGVAQACTQPATTQAFASFGDAADYWLAPGGNFETGGGPEWTWSKASIIDDADRVLINGPSDSHALSIQPGGQALSVAFCVDAYTPTLRLFAKKANTLGSLRVDVLATRADNRYREGYAGTIVQGASTGWMPSQILDLAAALPPGQVTKGDLSVQLRFTAGLEPGAWTIDDVYIDPYRFG